jgi:hypothetical protein
MLADVAVRRFADHLPFHRLQEIYARDGLRLARSTMCGWMIALANLLAPLIEAMFHDARQQPLLCVDASGVRIQANKQCARGHFWVMLAPERHALFRFSEEHTSDAVRELIGEDYRGKVLADAHTVYDFLFEQRCIECGCWAHARRYFHKALKSDPERAGHAMGTIRWLFAAEHAATTMEERLHIRDSASRPTVDAFFHWVQEQRNDPAVLDGSPISQALNYAHNQSTALRRYLDDARVPMHNNDAERALRHMAVGRNNWLFLGSPSGGVTAATFYTLIMSCKMHGLDPWSYLRDLFCLLPTWPSRRVIELAPVNWESTLARPEVQEELAANVYRAISIAENALPARQAEAA